MTLIRRLHEARRRYEVADAIMKRAVENFSKSKGSGADLSRAAEERRVRRAAYQDALSAFAAALGIVVRPSRQPASGERAAATRVPESRNSGAA